MDSSSGDYVSRRFSKKQREALVSIFGPRCFFCKKDLRNSTIHFDHLIPYKFGGATSTMNGVPSCLECNSRKGCKSDPKYVHRFD